MWAALGALVTGIAALFIKNGGGGLIPDKITLAGGVDVNIDLWETNKELFVLIFLLVAALIISRL